VVSNFLSRVDGAALAVTQMALRTVDDAADRLALVGQRLPTVAVRAVIGAEQRTQRCAQRVSVASIAAVTVADLHVATAANTVQRSARHRLDSAERTVAHLVALLAANDPARLLERGWSITSGPDGRVVRSVHEVVAGEVLTTRVSDGTISSSVNS
jgi:exodeoxyribonuclease VII large subunit